MQGQRGDTPMSMGNSGPGGGGRVRESTGQESELGQAWHQRSGPLRLRRKSVKLPLTYLTLRSSCGAPGDWSRGLLSEGPSV